MEIVADESVDFGVIKNLRNSGFEVLAITEKNAGISDIEVLKIAVNLKALLITEDKDFGEITFRTKHNHFGILLIRLSDIPRLERLHIISESIEDQIEHLYQNFSVLTKRGLRINKQI
ncbi:MAG: DUF5615 family PIN-like protein [Saprospiraceae bacterium]